MLGACWDDCVCVAYDYLGFYDKTGGWINPFSFDGNANTAWSFENECKTNLFWTGFSGVWFTWNVAYKI